MERDLDTDNGTYNDRVQILMTHIFNDFELLDLINFDEMMWESTHYNLVISNSIHAITSLHVKVVHEI